MISTDQHFCLLGANQDSQSVNNQLGGLVLIFRNRHTGQDLLRECVEPEDRHECDACFEEGAKYRYVVEDDSGHQWDIPGLYCDVDCMRTVNEDPTLEY